MFIQVHKCFIGQTAIATCFQTDILLEIDLQFMIIQQQNFESEQTLKWT